MEALAYFGVVFVGLNLLSFIAIVYLYGPRIYAVLRMPEDVKTRLLHDYARTTTEDLEDASI